MLKRVVSVAVAAVGFSLLSGCVVAPARSVAYAPVPAPRPVYAEFGRVENIGIIQVAQRQTGAGAILGAVIGGIVGNSVGSGMGKAVATGAGVVGGAVAGNAIEGRTRHDDEVYRVQVRFDNGSVRDFDFQRIDDLRIGDRVKFENGQVQRI